MIRRVWVLVSLALVLAVGRTGTTRGGLGRVRERERPRRSPASFRRSPRAGAGGSFFKTSVQLFNPLGFPLTARLVFHPVGAQGAVTDPSLDVAIEPLQTESFEDVVAAMGIGGLGTLDIMLPSPSNSPVVVARVYDDAGADGTQGFTQEAVSPNDSGAPDACSARGPPGT